MCGQRFKRGSILLDVSEIGAHAEAALHAIDELVASGRFDPRGMCVCFI